MKYSESFVFISLFYVMSNSFVNSTQLTELLNTINSKISNNNNNWNKVIHDTNILIDGNPKTIISYLNDKLEHDDETSVIRLNESNVLEVLNFVYTAFKCEYAFLVRYLLNIFFEYISSCETYFKLESTRISENTSSETPKHYCSHKTIIPKFIVFKNNIVKMIFNLFNFMDLSRHLESSDQTFLKSLLSINLFLCHLSYTDIKKSTTMNHSNILFDNTTDMNGTLYQNDHRIIVLKRVFVQIKDLVDHFRCKNCFVGYNYFNNSDDNNNKISFEIHHDNNIIIDDTLKSLKSKMDDFKDIGLDDVLYNDEMYDTKYLLAQQVFKIEIDQLCDYFTSTMSELYNKTDKSYDITVISNYQYTLLKSIEKLFYTKFKYIINMNQKQDLNELLLSSFNDYIDKMIPSKFLSDSCRVLAEKINSLMALSDWDEANSSKKEKVLELLNSALSENQLKTTDLDELINAISIPKLIKNITESAHLKSFFQTFKLFDQERNRNEDYNLLTMKAHKILKDRVDSDQNTLDYTGLCKATTTLRQILVLVSLVIIVTENYKMCTKDDDSADKEQCFQGILRLHLKGVFLYIDDLVEKTNDKNLHQVLVPISFHLENMGWTYRGENDDEAYTQYVTIYQYLLMTLGSIERYELSKCKSPEYNQTIHDKIIDHININAIQDNGKSIVDWLKTQIAFKTIKYNHNKNENEMYDYIDNHMFAEFLKLYNPVIYSTNYQFYWNGRKTYIFNIIQAITQDVIDYHDIIKYQMIIMNWFVATIYIRINSFLKCSLSKEEIFLIEDELYIIDREFNYPEMIKKDYMDTVQMYLNIFDMPETLEIQKQNFNNFIKKKLELFDFAAIEAELPEENCTTESLDKYFEITKITMFLLNINLL